MRKLLTYSIVLLVVILHSCDLDINEDPNYPTDVKASKYFSSAQMWIASAVGGDLELIGGMWAQHYAQNAGSNQYTNIDSYNIPNSSVYVSRTWSALYAGALPDLQLASEKALEGNFWHLWMASEILTAYTYHILVEAYGDIPYSQALDFHNNPNPVFDNAQSINNSLISILDEALTHQTEAEDAAVTDPMGNSDFLFKGNVESWVKFAKSLKLKILMRDQNFANNSTAINALLTENDLLDMDAKIAAFENKENISNPLYENDRRKLNTTQNIRASSTLSLFLFTNNDPRASVFMEPAVTSDAVYGDYVGIPQGGYTLGSSYINRTSRALIKATDPVYFMSQAEVEFLKAEAYVKLNDPPSAKISYDLGVTLAFDRWKGAKDEDDIEFVFPSDFDVNDFIGIGAVYEFDQTDQTTMLESIWRQMWLGFARTQEWEAFLTWNRTGYPLAGTVNSEDAAYIIGNFAPSINTVLSGEFPRRLIYPKTSSDYNINTPVTVPIQTKLWWHK